MHIAVLGAGMVGSAIALDLVKSHQITSFDFSEKSLAQLKERNENIHTRHADLKQYDQYASWLEKFDLVVTAVPGFMGFQTLEAVIQAGKNVVDISFFPEDALLLHNLAKEKNVTVITDCGVAPGMSNFIIGRYNEEMEIKSVSCYVGGLPLQPQLPWKYKAPFSPIDVIEEYTRPARLFEHGEIVVKPALSEREFLTFDQAGELEAFNTDGLRSLLFTMNHIPDMKEKTLRYRGHIDLIVALQESGFFSDKEMVVNGQKIIPIQLTTKLLLDQWKLGPGEKEFTVMKVNLFGNKNGQKIKLTYDLYDVYDEASQTSSMARTTGYTCAAAVELIANDLFTEKGVFPPEHVGKHKPAFEFVLSYLNDRNVIWRKQESVK